LHSIVSSFFGQLHRDARTSALLEDFQREERESWASFNQADRGARGVLGQVMDELSA
jgi:hypothetical protein